MLSYRTSPQARTGLVNGNAIWYARLFEDPAFKAKVKTRFQELLPQLETIPSYIDETEALLQKSADLNFNLWDPAEDASQNGGSIINGAFLRADAVDNISQVIAPVIADQGDKPLFSDAEMTEFRMISCERSEQGAVWIRYAK